MPENFRERADLTKIIKSILDSYPLGNGILRELLQNSDDAGATKQTFILDMRNHPQETVVDKDLAKCQGPALLAINDTLFSEEDWKAISTLHSSSKTADETKIGKFGIGVRACYHITDNPHFLSGRKLAIFDPHERFSNGREGGLRIDILTEGSMYPDQLAAFDRSLSAGADGTFPGTVVRLPLRTPCQALESKIKRVAVNPPEIEGLFRDFVERELSVVMLFLKHIRCICLKMILPDGQEKFFGSAEIPDLSIAEKRKFSRNAGARQETFRCAIDVTSVNPITGTTVVASQDWRIYHAVRSTDATSTFISGKLGYCVGSKLADDKLFSHVALAFPIDLNHPPSQFNGRLFTLLPLPIHTSFPVHLHAILALTQDRQSLRNIEETGTGPTSRERLLVTWNRAIFDEFLPEAWSALLQILVDNHEVEDIWSAWPAVQASGSSGSSYWTQILPNLLARVVDLDLPVFPTLLDAEQHVSLSSAFVASEYDDVDIMNALSKVGLSIVKLPKHVRKLLHEGLKVSVLHPNLARDALLVCFYLTRAIYTHPLFKTRISALKAATEEEKDHILRYLVQFPGTIENAIGLPLVPSRGPRISLSRTEKYCLVTEQEAEVFGDSDCNGHFILLSKMDPNVAEIFCSPSAATVNVTRLNNIHIQNYLNHSWFARLNPADDEIMEDTPSSRADWLAKFWRWMAEVTWDGPPGLLPHIKRYHLLPTGQGTLRKLESGILLPIHGANGDPFMAAWGILGVSFLHANVVPYVSAIPSLKTELVVSPNDVVFLIKSILPERISRLDSDSALSIQNHLVQSLRLSGSTVRLDEDNKRKFQQLPIFPTRTAVHDWKEGQKKLSQPVVATATGTIIYVRVDDTCPVPVAPSQTTFFDITPSSGILRTLLGSVNTTALDELGVLEMAIDELATQPQDICDALLSRIIPRLPDLRLSTHRKLQSIPFVLVEGNPDSKRLSPAEVVDPRSELASLYLGEAGKLPRASGRFRKEGPELSLLMAHVPFQTKLTAEIIAERIAYLSRNWSANDLRIFTKAQRFLRLLDASFSSIQQTSHVASLPTEKWMPIRKDAPLAAPSTCRDGGEKPYDYLFDLVLSVVSEKISNQALRKSLGWDEVPMPVLQKQLSCALTHRKNRPFRLHALITELSRRLNSLSDRDIEDLRRVVSDRAWVPIDEATVVETNFALLRPSTNEPVLGGRFKYVPSRLLKAHNGQGRMFLQRMGCTESPCLETLLVELELLAQCTDRSRKLMSEALGILEEVVRALPNCSQDDYRRIFVPGRDCVLHPITLVYYVDANTDFLPEIGYPADSKVSESLARHLRLQFLSSLELGETYDDEDDLQMGEDFTERIKGVLKEHDVEYALNEFLANAVDAKASEFSVLLSERVFESSKVVAPTLADLQKSPSLILFNNATFSEADFRGLRMVGQGGKRADPDSIGRYGLGALSLFHFTDVVQIVSDEYILILDPSGTHLPPRKGTPRTSLFRRISDVARRYPDQLAPFESVHGFSRSAPSYPGTLFRLPLRNTDSALSSTVLQFSNCLNLLNGRYFDLAKDAMFFTSMKHISAMRQLPGGLPILLWSVDADRTPTAVSVDCETVSLNATSQSCAISRQPWLVTKSTIPIHDVPDEYHGVLKDMHLHESRVGLVIRMAFRLDLAALPEITPQTYFLFSSLRLPVQTSLSVHISAQFAISSDRRHIRFDPSDQSGHRIPQAAFNNWILHALVPPLYISGICRAVTVLNTQKFRALNPFVWWPVKQDNDDAISRGVIEAFYDLVVKSSEPICCTVTSKLVAPINAVIRGDRTSLRLHDLMLHLQPPTYVDLPYEIHKMVVKPASTSAAEGQGDQMRFVDPAFVRKVLQSGMTRLITLFDDKRISAQTIDAVLLFMLEGSVPVVDLPLLVLADGKLASGNSEHPTKYIFTGYTGSIPSIFSRSHFLHGELDEKTRKLLIASPEMNVKNFDAAAVLALVKEGVPPQPRCYHSRETQRWISSFWDIYSNLPGPPTSIQIRPLPLIRTVQGEYISLEYCERDDVLTQPVDNLALGVVSAMQKMALVFCQVPRPLTTSLNKPFDIEAFLKAIQLRSLPFSALSTVEVLEVGLWIRSQVSACGDAESRNTVRGLPIWEARKNSNTLLLPANDLEMLPPGVELKAFDGYTTFGFAVATYSQELKNVLDWPPVQRQALTSERLAQRLTFPASLRDSDMHTYSMVLTEFLKVKLGEGAMPVPDGNLRLRQVHELYDHSVELFSAALQSCGQSVFLHPSFQQFNVLLRAKGLRFEIDWDAFLFCAKTVDEELVGHHLESEIMERAGLVYNFYDSRLPGIVMTNTNQWSQLDGLRFIRRDEQRSTSSSYGTDSYVQQLPEIVAPSQLLLRKYEQVAWTQRGLFHQNDPSEGLISLNKSLGVPTAMEVVNHLAVLALQVAPEHPGNRSLLQQVRATYQWLNENKEEAREFLLARSTTDALFLNVDDPADPEETWEWRPAEQLQFDIPYDYPETKTFQVHRFLQDYRPLLLASGADNHQEVNWKPQGTAQDGNALRDVFNHMRNAGELTDLRLMPSKRMAGDEAIDVETLRAHSTFLAAAIPHVRVALLGWREGNLDIYEFPGTYFGARAVLDFIYTGKMEPEPVEKDAGHMMLLQNLLELLEDSDVWDMPELKDEIGRVISERKLLSRDTYRM
ncbi:hypothetical protein GGX14DRAFT_602035, partial [Mycena pura]